MLSELQGSRRDDTMMKISYKVIQRALKRIATKVLLTWEWLESGVTLT